MSPRECCDYLEDMLTNIQDIEIYLAHKSLDDLVEDSQLRKAVLFSFQVIGEAAGKVSDDVKQRYPEVPWQKIKDFRNQLVHSYFNINHVLVWAVYEEQLIPLKQQLEAVIQRECAP